MLHKYQITVKSERNTKISENETFSKNLKNFWKEMLQIFITTEHTTESVKTLSPTFDFDFIFST